ncbi:MAG: GTP cyclohydrolase II [Rhodobacterales bacterium]|nr:MAG: GTP cyclohydrolase II [Rhodobacterales bacterium]
MSLAPDPSELTARARADLRAGVPVVLGDAVVLAAEVASPARLEAMRALGAPVLALTARRAKTLHAPAYDGDLVRICLPREARADWLRAMADPAMDLRAPMKGPFRFERDGPADLHRAALRLLKEAELLPAALIVRPKDIYAVAAENALTALGGSAPGASSLRESVSARLPMEASRAGRLHVFRPEDGGEEHYAIEIGQPDRSAPVLCRLHSACFTGDVLGSLKCDCGPQLHAALARMGEEGAGVLLYLNQEGRGIGLTNKMRAYDLQDQGFDTVEANHRLGFEDDERDFRLGARILSKMGFGAVRLLTNNPAKVARMEEAGIKVSERVPLKVGRNPLNEAYLATKAAKSGHLL